MPIAPKISPSTRSGSDITEAIPWRMASSLQGVVFGSVSMSRLRLNWPVRIAVPEGPRPRSLSAQEMLSEST
ncbi:hypothetical protein D3C84_1184510 [compost metagenome]